MGINKAILAAALALVCAACASGRGGPPGYDDEDRGGDGPPRPRTQLFISPSGQPFRAPGGQPYPVAAWFAEADRDRDGRLTRDEFRADADAWFKALDVNADGRIDMPEVTRWEEELVPEITRAASGGGGGERRRKDVRGRNELSTHSQGAAPYSLINEPHPIRGADTDLSFSVSVAEWRAASDRRFAILDIDGDGAVALADLRATEAQGRQGREGPGSREGREGREGPPGGGRRKPG